MNLATIHEALADALDGPADDVGGVVVEPVQDLLVGAGAVVVPHQGGPAPGANLIEANRMALACSCTCMTSSSRSTGSGGEPNRSWISPWSSARSPICVEEESRLYNESR